MNLRVEDPPTLICCDSLDLQQQLFRAIQLRLQLLKGSDGGGNPCTAEQKPVLQTSWVR